MSPGKSTDEAQREIADRILRVAQQLANEEHGRREAHDVARDRGWLDAEGHPTKDGRDLVAALREQSSTRTVFRNM